MANAGVEYMVNQVRILPRPIILWVRATATWLSLSPILSPLEIGVNAERTTSSATERTGAGNSSGGNTVLDSLFNLVTPLIFDSPEIEQLRDQVNQLIR